LFSERLQQRFPVVSKHEAVGNIAAGLFSFFRALRECMSTAFFSITLVMIEDRKHLANRGIEADRVISVFGLDDKFGDVSSKRGPEGFCRLEFGVIFHARALYHTVIK